MPLADNPGFGSAADAGAQRAVDLGCTALVFLNPDALIDHAGLRRLADEVAGHPLRMVAPRIDRPDGAAWFNGAVVDRRTGLPGRRPADGDAIPWLTGACLGISASLWSTLGGFDDDYFMYWEDVDLSYRCVAAGGDVVLLPEVVVVHDVGRDFRAPANLRCTSGTAAGTVSCSQRSISVGATSCAGWWRRHARHG